MRRSLIVGLLSLGLVLVASGAVFAADNVRGAGPEFSPPCPGQNFPLIFADEGDAFLLDVTTNTNGGLRVTTTDCCVPGDIWRATVIEAKAQTTGSTKSANGVVDDYAGLISRGVAPGHLYTVIVTYDVGTDIFPAQVDVCIEGPEGAVTTVTPRP